MTIVTQQNFSDSISQLMGGLIDDPTIIIDIESNGTELFSNKQLCGIGIGIPSKENFLQYYPFRHKHTQGENLDNDQLIALISILSNNATTFIGHNLKFDLHFLEDDGLVVDDKKMIDTIVMLRMIEHSDEKQLGLTKAIHRHFGENHASYDIETKKELRSNKWNKDFSLSPADWLGEYCKKDVYYTGKLYRKCKTYIEQWKLHKVVDLQINLTKVLYKMERRGIFIDSSYANRVNKTIDERLEVVEDEILKISGKTKEEFNISSPLQIGEVFNSMNPPIHSPVQTPKGEESWGEAALVNINHRMAGLLRQYRTLAKLKSTYIKPHLDKSIEHTQFQNWGAATGRLSSANPNLQNIPRNHFKLEEKKLSKSELEDTRDKIAAAIGPKGISMNSELSDDVISTWNFLGDETYNEENDKEISIRRLFIPRKDYYLVGFDYIQMEVRVFLSYFRYLYDEKGNQVGINDEINNIITKSDVDFHAEAARLAFNVETNSPKFKQYRQAAKAITFGTIYGIGNKRLAQQINTTPEEAGKYKKSYFEGITGAKEFIQDVIKKIYYTGSRDNGGDGHTGFIRNKYGRVYQLDREYAYKGVNYLVQGTSADLLGERMIEVDKYLDNKKSNILLQVHDEIICEVHKSELEVIPNKIKQLLTTNSLGIPLDVDVEILHPSWATKQSVQSPIETEINNDIDWDSVPYEDESGIEWV